MSRRKQIAVAALVLLVVAGALYLPGLYRRVTRLGRNPLSEEAERRAVAEPPLSTPSDVLVEAPVFWVSKTDPNGLEEDREALKLSADPVERGKQLLDALIAGPPDPAQRTLPPGASLEEFYLLPEGTAVADFSNTLSTEMPSGIESEQLAVESIADTLAANIPNLRRLKILIGGQEAQALAGHIDLTGYFTLSPPAPPPAPAPGPAPKTPR